MKAIKYITILVASIFVFNSCTKQVAGPAGPTGATGSQGPSASYSVTIDSINGGLSPSPWGQVGSNFVAYINNVKALTTPNNSIVEVYISQTYNQFSTWYELPVANFLQATDAFSFSYELYTVNIQYAFTSAPTGWLYFKVVVINQP